MHRQDGRVKVGTSEIARAVLTTSLPPAARLIAVAAATFIGRRREPDGSAVVYLAVSQLSELTGYTSDRTLRTHIQTLERANLPWLRIIRHPGSRAEFRFSPAIVTDAAQQESGKKRRGSTAQTADPRGNDCRTRPEEFADAGREPRQTVPTYTTGAKPDERDPERDHAHQRPGGSGVGECKARRERSRAPSGYDQPQKHYPRPFDEDVDALEWWEALIDLDGHRYVVPWQVRQTYDCTSQIDNPGGFVRFLCHQWQRGELVLAGPGAIRHGKTAREAANERERERIRRELGFDPDTPWDEATGGTVIDHDKVR